MYRKFFGLSELPFKSTPNVNMFFGEASRQSTFEALLYTIQRGDGIVKVTGEVGCGKTMILRMVAENLDNNYKIVYINSPNLSPKDILFFIADELAVSVNYDLAKFQILKLIKNRLIEYFSSAKKVVLLIDEAQSIPIDTLEELRLLSNLETNEDKLLQIVLFGQPELDTALKKPEIRQLASRITYSINLPKFKPTEVMSYLNYRLRAVGYRGLDIFDLKMAKEIYKVTDGLPRGINEVADKLLMAMFSQGDTKATRKHLKALQLRPVFFSRKKAPYFISISIVLILVSAFVFNSLNLKYSDELGVETINPSASKLQQEREASPILTRTLKQESLKEIAEPTIIEHSIDERKEVKPLVTEIIDTGSFEKNLVLSHLKAIEIFNSIPDEYNVIQLATVTSDAVQDQVQAFDSDSTVAGRYILLVETLPAKKAYRVKFFLKSFGNYSMLSKELKQLSVSVKSSNPYILSVKGLRARAEEISLEDLK